MRQRTVWHSHTHNHTHTLTLTQALATFFSLHDKLMCLCVGCGVHCNCVIVCRETRNGEHYYYLCVCVCGDARTDVGAGCACVCVLVRWMSGRACCRGASVEDAACTSSESANNIKCLTRACCRKSHTSATICSCYQVGQYPAKFSNINYWLNSANGTAGKYGECLCVISTNQARVIQLNQSY